MIRPEKSILALIITVSVSLLSTIAQGASIRSGTSVGGGGDPLYYYLEATRGRLIAVIDRLASEPRTQPDLCLLPQMSAVQQDFCRDFFVKSLVAYRNLNVDSHKTKFIIREDPLVVTGPDGRDITVVARTPLGSDGEVEFYRPMLKPMGPPDVLLLIAHEFGHKVPFENTVIGDNDPVGPFATGREFLDNVGASVVDFAKRQNLIGREYHLLDQYFCRVSQSGSLPMGGVYANSRVFDDNSLANYRTGVGFTEAPSGPSIIETDALVKMQIVIHDKQSCIDSPEANASRSTETRLVRVFNQTPDNPEYREEEITSLIFPGLNPLCADHEIKFKLSYALADFECSYHNSVGAWK